jgi:molecular chaperone GrpE (heat shock protein)
MNANVNTPAANPGPLPEDPSPKISKIAESCVRLFDELDKNMGDFDQGKRELAEHIMARIEVILESAGVEAINGETEFDRTRHEPDKAVSDGAEIAETITPGFSLGRRVLRRARVRIA